MTIGERIQFYRKKLGMSQEELGQKLLVSRQTISLWEKDQTNPTIDNLIRLKEIFSVSIDEMLSCEDEHSAVEVLPDETYQFSYSKEELSEIYRCTKRIWAKRKIKRLALGLAFVICLIIVSAPDLFIGCIIGILFIDCVSYIKEKYDFKKRWAGSLDKVIQSTYVYQVFNDSFTIIINRNNETVRTSKVCFQDIEHIQDMGKYIVLDILGQSFILRKADLSKNSAFYIYMNNNPDKTMQKKTYSKWKVISVVLFIATLFSIYGALLLVGIVSSKTKLMTDNMWLFFLMTPIPIASIIYGLFLKSKGYKYKLNLITGIITTVLLCIFGSFTFIFANIYDHGTEPIIKAEQMLGIDIPQHKQINTQDWTNGTQSVSRGYIYSTSDIYFDENSAKQFEDVIKADDRWLSLIPNDIIGIASPFCDYEGYDYILIYNIDESEYNTLPQNSGTYNFVNVIYHKEDNQMKIVEYNIEYIK